MHISRIALEETTALASPYISRHIIAPAPKRLIHRARTRDAIMTIDQATADSTGAFLIGELERLDPTLHEPLAAVSWGRDIQLREDVTIADEDSSFTNTAFAAAGGTNPNGVSWIGKDSNAIPRAQIDIGKTKLPLTLWGEEVSFSIPELESSLRLQRPIDATMLDSLHLKHQMDIDQVVYIGDTLVGFPGMTNGTNAAIASGNVANGAGGSPLWSQKTPTEILADVNTLLTTVWQNSAWAVLPTDLRLPPADFSYIVSQLISTAGSKSIYQFLRENSLCNSVNNRPLNIQPLKWLIGRGAGATSRMMAYTNDKRRIRYPLTPLQHTPVEWRSIYQVTTYFCRLGMVEFVYPETVGYADGI